MNSLEQDALFARPPAPYYALNRAEVAAQRAVYQAALAVFNSSAPETARQQAQQAMSDAEHRLAMSGHAIEPTDVDKAQAAYDALEAETSLKILKDLAPEERTLRVEKLKGAWRKLLAAREAAEAAARGDDGDVETTTGAAEVPEPSTNLEFLAPPAPYYLDR